MKFNYIKMYSVPFCLFTFESLFVILNSFLGSASSAPQSQQHSASLSLPPNSSAQQLHRQVGLGTSAGSTGQPAITSSSQNGLNEGVDEQAKYVL